MDCVSYQLGDLGVARVAVEMCQTLAGTPIFMAPEVLAGMPYAKESDIFSLGTTLYLLCMLTVPFKASSMVHLTVISSLPDVVSFVTD